MVVPEMHNTQYNNHVGIVYQIQIHIQSCLNIFTSVDNPYPREGPSRSQADEKALALAREFRLHNQPKIRKNTTYQTWQKLRLEELRLKRENMTKLILQNATESCRTYVITKQTNRYWCALQFYTCWQNSGISSTDVSPTFKFRRFCQSAAPAPANDFTVRAGHRGTYVIFDQSQLRFLDNSRRSGKFRPVREIYRSTRGIAREEGECPNIVLHYTVH